MSKDDNVAKKPNLLPYGSNVGAPSIKPTDISSWKDEKVVTTNHYFSSRYDEIKKDYLKLMEEYEWNTLVYNAEFRFKPVMGKIYFLYSFLTSLQSISSKSLSHFNILEKNCDLSNLLNLSFVFNDGKFSSNHSTD